MNYLKDRILVLITLFVTFSFFACTPLQEQEPIDGFEVIFYGESCGIDAPDQLPAGEYHFTLDNQSQLVQASLTSRIGC